MTRQSKSKAKGSERTTIGGGGAATSAGILFQQQVGAIFSSWLLAERRLDIKLNLGSAKPAWLRFETEAPVDDILVGTSDGGFVAIQAKTNIPLSKKLDSPFGKTISQFVKHWLECRKGDGSLKWNRHLNSQVDRLVLAVSPSAPSTLRQVLPKALQLKSQAGEGQLNAEQKRAFDCFEACVRTAWLQATSHAYSPDFAQELAVLIRVITLDTAGSSRDAAIEALRDVAQGSGNATAIFSGLEAVCGRLMAERGGVDHPTLRQRLLGSGFRLLSPPEFQPDIARLKDHSNETAKTLKRFEEIEAADGKPISIVRECQDAVRDAAFGGSLLIIGGPGAGKSGILNALARDLRDKESDVLEIAVDGHSVETLEGLEKALCLEHGLIKTLGAWDGNEPAWLIVDGLDASRGGHVGGVFRTLIEQVMKFGGRWNVIASIRTFDLRMGRKFQELFKGQPPVEGLTEQEFSNVRHVIVPPWTQTEFAQLLEAAPSLAAAMTNAPENLLDVARVPFNTRLLNDLVNGGLVSDDLSHVASQAELLQLYWKYRVDIYGASARTCIMRVVKSMVKKRVLRAPFEVAAERDPKVLDDLEGEGVLISIDNNRGIQFRHHLLFDFAAARVLLDSEALIDGSQRFCKAKALGLMLAPALTFALQEIWMRKDCHAAFWTATTHILADKDGDPVIQSVTSRTCAELPKQYNDMAVLAEQIVEGADDAAKALSLMSGALDIRLDDYSETPLAPWFGFVRNVASNVAPVHRALRFILFRLVGRIDDQNERRDLGIAARALLDHAFSLEDPGNLVSSAIHLVGDTYASDRQESRGLLKKIFAPDRLDFHAAQEVPALCRKIDKIAAIDPEFGARIYRETFGFEVNNENETYVINSQIVPLTSNMRQDYGMARYELKEYFDKFLRLHPKHAVEAVVHCVETYVARNHAPGPNLFDAEIQVDGRRVRLRGDQESHLGT